MDDETKRATAPAALGPAGVAVVVIVALWYMITNISAANDAQSAARAASAIRADLTTLTLIERSDGAPEEEQATLDRLESGLDQRLDVALDGVGRAERERLRTMVADRITAARSGEPVPEDLAALMDVQFAALATDAGERADSASYAMVRGTYLTAVLALFALLVAVTMASRHRALRAVAVARDSAEGRHRALLENAPLLVFVIGRDGTLEYASPRAQAVYGRESSRVESLVQQLSPAHAEFGASLVDQTVECETPHIIQSANGAWFEVVVSDHRDHRSIEGLVVTARDISERVALESLLRRQATEDALTGTTNRRGLDLALDAAVESARTSSTALGVLLVDLDGFKQVNDERGHVAGDEVLAQIGARLNDAVRTGEQIARYGGDEFAVIVERLRDREGAEAVARRLTEALQVPCLVGDELISFGASIGIALGTGDTAPGALLEAADRAMYRAKAAGGGCWRWADTADEALEDQDAE